MVHIRDLPSDILLDLLSRVPGRDLIRNCRLVCLQWRDLVDLATLWKRKCLQEGFDPETPDRSVLDWKIFYFLCFMKRNLIQNPCGEDGFNFWEIESHEGDKWRIEELPGARRRDFPRHPVPKYFVTSQGPSTKHQLISLKEEGYWDELMDETKPDIVVKDWFHCGCPCRYQLRVKLLSADSRVLQEFRPKDVIVEQCSDREWREVSYTFHNYPAGVRHVLFKHGGQGWYGMRITNSSVTVGPETGE
ncbi:PREDICTED: F-box only protein 6-like isoform X2 [Gekko japonicus]|uniref:F-box only protein 6-like isoform X2 n=1 Tax=Gekko japonicus TaxID=146911 RepID=A0ABM1JU23_GEKJA|nr:PREDICTED: F-box only protein 6-like isoform X2 [Gekko japonicus]XP_015264962.1 PREDICTED: F-box only protein 6-like isoform X2 [Gekko japonicus]